MLIWTGTGGKPFIKESCKNIEDLCSSFDLIDIYRTRNPDVRRFTWRQKNPVVQRRLDFWLINSTIQEEVENVDIIPAIRTDHSAITLHISGIEETGRGPSFWKFNSSLLEDNDYIKLVTDKYSVWLEEGQDFQDPRILWDFIKYKIRYETINYSKQKARNRREKLSALEDKIKKSTADCDAHPTPENLNELEILQIEYDRHYEYMVQGSIIRSRANWYEHGEKSNKYFLNLENYNKKKSCIRKLITNDISTTDPKQIMNEIHKFYANLYDTDCRDRSGLSTDEYLSNITTKVLTEEQRRSLDDKISTNEYFEALKSFQTNKTPGNDGLTVEFYLGFWHLVGKCLVKSLNFAHEQGQLSNSQKQAMITLLEKKGKDRRFIKNWRPISLINVDVKIASKAIARRLEQILPDLIHPNQNGFIKGRSIQDGVRTVEDILEFAKLTDRSGILLAIDFEKAFDSLNRSFLFKVLKKFNFGPYFLQWIETFYSNISSCVLNNGFTTDLFPVRGGVRQGDPLAPLLFILALETLACQIREDNGIRGILVEEEEIKLTLFADDMTCFLRDMASYYRLVVTLQLFSKFSNLQVNNDKTEIFAIGRHFLDQSNFPHKIRTSIKILGIYFDYNVRSRLKTNFESILKSIRDILNMWKWRGLTLLGRIQIVKSFIIPKVLSKAALIAVTEDLTKEINSLIYRFIWKGNDKIKRAALINDIEDGGLKMLDIQLMILAQRVMVLKRFADRENKGSWKITLSYFLSQVGGEFILKCNFDTRKLPVYLPALYKECLDAWSVLNQSAVSSYDDVVQQAIWNNKDITVEQRSIFKKDLFSKGIITIGDLLSDDGIFLKGVKVLNANLSPIEYFSLMSIVDAIPREWRQMIRQNTQHVPPYISDTIYLNLDNSEISLSKVSSKLLYKVFKNRKQVPPTAQKKFEEKFPYFSFNWNDIYSLPFIVTIETKIREFQYKILNNIVFTNEKMFKFKMTDSPLCSFCKREVESLEHLLYYCDVTKTFWEAFCSWLGEFKINSHPFTITEILFGVFDVEDDWIILNHLILIAKYYIYTCKLKKVNPSLQVCKAKIRAVYQVEKKIATRRNKLTKHYGKWERLLPHFSSETI